ncbi:MAG: HIT family protein [Candidatus Saccharibacteria bacterium]
MQEPSLFTKIIRKEIPANIIYEDEQVIAFLTIHPLAEGHTLVVPKKQVEQIWDLEPDDYNYLWKTAQKIALHLRSVMNVDKVGVVVKGFEVPHTHIHLIPVNRHSGVNFDPEPSPPAEDNDNLVAIADRIRL